MLRTYEELNRFRDSLVWMNGFDYFKAYEEIVGEVFDTDVDEKLYSQIEKTLLDWLKKNAKKNVYYRGDLQFEFESGKDRDRFDAENGDPVAFKLMWT